jgi:integrase
MRLFISYSRVDKPTCNEIVKKLARTAHEVWWDHQVYGGQRWWNEILKKLEWCEVFVYLLSPESLASDYCRREYQIAKDLGRYVIPVLIRARTIIPEELSELNDIQHVDFSEGIASDGIVELLGSLSFAEKELRSRESHKSLEDLRAAEETPPSVVGSPEETLDLQLDQLTGKAITPHAGEQLTFNFAMALPGRASSRHTGRAYFRWVDHYLVSIAGLKPSVGSTRFKRMSTLSIPLLQESLSAPQLRAWLGMLAHEGHGKQGIGQARAAVVTLASLLSEAGWLDDYTSAAMSNVRPPKAEEGQRPGRWLSPDQIRMLMMSARQIATSENQMLRNMVVATVLCTMALRREELASARWGDLSTQNDRVVLRVHGKGRKTANIDVPRSVLQALDQWRRVIVPGEPRPPAASPLVRRIWKGGRVSQQSLTPDGIWLVIGEAAAAADLGHVAPHDLRRSVAGALQQAGVPIEKISRLLRHTNVAVTERYLGRLPQRNEGAVLMSDILGLDYWDS